MVLFYGLAGSGSGFRSRRAKMTQKNRKNLKKIPSFEVSAGCSLLMAEYFSCSLDVL
jgi:hypothetical protein